MESLFTLLADKLKDAPKAPVWPKFDPRYPTYQLERGETVTWLKEPLPFATLGGQPFVCLGISDQLGEKVMEALVVSTADNPAGQPVLLGRLLKFSPALVVIDETVVKRLRRELKMA